MKTFGNKNSFYVGVTAGLVFILIAVVTNMLLSRLPLKITDINSFNIMKLSGSLPRPYIVESGSMEPKIRVGGIIFVLPSNNYQIGDVITFSTTGSRTPTTHRVIGKSYPEGLAGGAIYNTKGDANEDPDNFEVSSSQIVGKVALALPYLGYFADYAKKPQGFIFLVIVPATIIVYEELRFLKRELAKIFSTITLKVVKKFKTGKTELINSPTDGKPLPKAAVVLPIIGSVLVLIAVSASYFSDVEQSLSNILQSIDWSTNGLRPDSVETQGPQLTLEPSPTETPTQSEQTEELTPTPTETQAINNEGEPNP